MIFCRESIADIAIYIKTGKTPPTRVVEYFNGNINWYTPTDLSKGIFLGKSSRTITDKAIHENKAVVFDKNTVLISCIGDIGKLGIVTETASSNQQITGIKLNNKVYPLFFYYWCKRNKRLLERNSRQAIIPILSNDALAKIKISYIKNYDDQIRIATVLTRAEKLIAKRKESTKALDEFLKSTFLEMFGDPVRNEKGWATESLEKVCKEIYRYPTFYGHEYISLGVPVVRIGNILKNGEIDPVTDNYVCIPLAISEKYPRTILELNDILMAVRGDGSTGKRIGIVKSQNLIGANISPNLLRFSCNVEMLEPKYFFYFITSDSGQNLISRYISRTAKKTITAQNLKSIKIPLPPLKLQNEFAAIVEKVEALKVKYTQSLVDLEHLYGSLSQRAFKGELDLSKVPVEK